MVAVFLGVSGIAAVGAEMAPGLAELKKLYVRPKEIPYPPENPYSKAKSELGRHLFYDPRLSGSQMISCASCHNPSFSWGDSLAKGVGHGHKTLGRRTPTVLNMAWGNKMFWDGRAATLEEQALGPIASEGEMNMALGGEAGLIARLGKIPNYKPMFAEAFPGEADPLTTENIAKAIATFERSIVSGTAPFDRFVRGDAKAISPSAQRGFVVFNTKAKCSQCHSGWNFTDNSFHDIGVPGDDIGRGKFLKMATQQHAFKTPTLRNADQRAPFMHDGSEATLEDIVEFYNLGGKAMRPGHSSLIQPLDLSAGEKTDLVAFLKTLTSNDKAQSFPVLPR